MLSAVDVSSVNLKSVYFANDDFLIFTASEYQRLNGFINKFDLSSAFVVNTASGKARQLLFPGDGVIYKGQTGLGRIVGAVPEGSYVYMPAFIQPALLDLPPDYSLVRVRLDKRIKPQIARGGSNISDDFFVDAQGNPIAEEQYSDKTNLHVVLAKQGDNWIKIYENENPSRNIVIVGLTPDEKSLVMLGNDEKAGRTGYFTMSLKDGSLSESIFNRIDADVEDVITDINRIVYGVRYAGFKPSYQFF
ncbi:MAG: hypothetical protein U5M23_16175 [Marinagarivorans sp.]|nr:hypothetical protein [Marinagarivorans sp.]